MTPHSPSPDLVMLNGVIRTMDKHNQRSQAIAIKGKRIMAIGDNKVISAIADSSTERIDLEGRLVLPGMMDSHFHFYDWAMGRNQLELANETSLEQLLEKVNKAARTMPGGNWILGQGWNESDWSEHTMPDRSRLDAVAPNHPVALWRCDLHLVAVNSMALNLAGIGKDTRNPEDGVIEKNASGEPTGILRELAPNLIKAVIPEPDSEEILAAMRDGISHLHSLGLTGIHDVRLMGGLEGATALKAWQLLNERDELNLRCWVSLPGERLEEAAALGLRTGMGNDRLRIGHLKYFADGGMGARTAWMLEPYLDAEYGMPLSSMVELKRAVQKAEKAGLAVIIHAIGDRTNREIITLFEDLAKTRARDDKNRYDPPLLPHRIEHTQMIRSEDITRLAKLGVAACVQPHNMILDINMIDESVGPRGRHTYAYKEMIDAGIPIMFSSDAPVCDPSPLVGIHAAVTRQRRDGTPENGWYPDQRISVEQAIQGYTTVPAEFYGRSQELGTLTPGKKADMIVLDRNIFDVNPMQIHDTQVDITIFDGKIVYRRGGL
ncbi:MAG: amidohydrolase [Deltaproteobacteria bacterium]|nr:MAG: amidohydrolase [Deltaproteobacteria bacterium]